MEKISRWSILIMLALLLSLGMGAAYGATTFPEKPITLIVHSGAGGGSDIFARVLAAANDKEKFFPQPVVVENKPGGSGAVAFAYVAGKKKDPYFILTSVASFLTTPLMGQSPLSYKDFTPIANFAFDENVLVVNANSKYKSVQDIVTEAKANPQKLTVTGSQAGAIESVCTYQFEKAAGIKLNYISGGGGGTEPIVQVLGGHIDMTVANPGEALELQKAGKLRILAVFSEKRLALAPELPTFKDLGYNVTGAANNRGISAPGGIPEDARKVLEEGLFKYTKTDLWKKYVKDNMLTEVWMDSATFGKWLGEQNARYEAVYREMGVLKKK
jgi:putative tricarboxylic transport membrane protein